MLFNLDADGDTEIGRICDRPTEHPPASAIARINHTRRTTFDPAVAASSITPFFRAVDRELADRDLRIKTKETGFFTESRSVNEVFHKKPGFWLSVCKFYRCNCCHRSFRTTRLDIHPDLKVRGFCSTAMPENLS